jgi:hypothetical protein
MNTYIRPLCAEYTTNAARRPKLVVTYTDPTSGIYTATAASHVSSLFYDGVRLVEDTATPTAPAADKWGWAGNVLYLNKGDPSGHAIETITDASQNDGIVVGNSVTAASAKDYVTIDGLEVTYVKRWLLNGINTDNLIVQNCTLHHTGIGDGTNDPVGIALNMDTINALVLNNVIDDTKNEDTSKGAGIYIGTAFTDGSYSAIGNVIRGNTVSNAHTGIVTKYQSVSNIIEQNIVHDCAVYGIRSAGDATTGRNIIRRNYVYNVTPDGATGIETFNNADIYYNIFNNCYIGVYVNANSSANENSIDAGDGNNIYNNTFYNGASGLVGIWFANTVSTTCSNNVVKNNAMSNMYRFVWWNYDDTFAGTNLFNYNIYYPGVAAGLFRVGAGNSTLAQWKTYTTDQDVNSIQNDPLFTSSTDFHPLPNSPAINAGVSVGLTTDYSGRPIQLDIDIGAYETESRRRRAN